MIFAVIGNFGSGKSSIIRECITLLEQKGISCCYLGIDELRKEFGVEEKGDVGWNWHDEASVHQEIFKRALKAIKSGSLVFIESACVNANIRRLKLFSELRVIKVECDPRICIQRCQERERELFFSTEDRSLEELIFEIDEGERYGLEDFCLDSSSQSLLVIADELFRYILEEIKLQSDTFDFQVNYKSSYITKIEKQFQQRKIARDATEQRDLILNENLILVQISQIIAIQVDKQKAHQAYPGDKPVVLIYGGYVRDALQGLKPKDADIQVFGLSPVVLRGILEDCFPGRVRDLGSDFNFLRIHTDIGYEVDVVIRQDSPDVELEQFDNILPKLTPRAAVKYHDFASNSLFADPLTGEVFDWCDGISDIEKGILRVVDMKTYHEHHISAIRIYRAAQFSARLGARLDPGSRDFFRKKISEGYLHLIRPYSLTIELEKLFLKSKFPSIGLDTMREIGLLAYEFPELQSLVDKEANRESQDWSNTLSALDFVANRFVNNDEFSISTQNKFALFIAVAFAATIEQREIDQTNLDEVYQRLRLALTLINLTPKQLASIIDARIFRHKVREIYCWYHTKRDESLSLSKPQTNLKRQAAIIPFKKNNDPEAELEKELIQKISDLMASIRPMSFEAFLVYFEATDFLEKDKKKSSAKKISNFFIEKLNEHNINLSQAKTLIDKDDLKVHLEITSGQKIGILIGEVEKRRAVLITKERAINFLKKHIKTINLESLESQNQKTINGHDEEIFRLE